MRTAEWDSLDSGISLNSVLAQNSAILQKSDTPASDLYVPYQGIGSLVYLVISFKVLKKIVELK